MDLVLNETVYKAKVLGQEVELIKPRAKDIATYSDKLREAGEDAGLCLSIQFELLVSCGMTSELLDKLDIGNLQALVEFLVNKKKE